MYNIILAAGKSDFRNLSQGMVSSQLLAMVNGRPIIAWVISDLYKKTDDPIIIAIDNDDAPMVGFLRKHYENDDRVRICLVKEATSILHSLQSALNMIPEETNGAGLRLNLGDTLLASEPWTSHENVIYVSDFFIDSGNWCVAEIDGNNQIRAYHNKKEGLPKTYKALVGRYEFSDIHEIRHAVATALSTGNREISSALEIYGRKYSLSARQINQEQWIDFGHLEGMARARSKLIESRSFNSLSIHPTLPEIVKHSTNTKKIAQEIYWYQELPSALQSLAPRILSISQDADYSSIRMEYYGYGTLAEKYVYLNLSNSFWKTVLRKLFTVVEILKQHSAPPQSGTNLHNIYYQKTLHRLTSLKEQNGIWAGLLEQQSLEIDDQKMLGLPLLMNFISQRCDQLASTAQIAIVHGDLCFNNILYDVNSGIVKLIDPRGEFGAGVNTIYGDPRYDIAKLRHSYCGKYDFIIEGDFSVSTNQNATSFTFKTFEEEQENKESVFDELVQSFGYQTGQIRFIEALLFLSMIPLHQDSQKKQLAFFISAIKKLNRCYAESS